MIDVLLLLALPASGKSELRRYLEHGEPVLGGTVQLDDFPYVHMMRRISDESQKLGAPVAYFEDPQASFVSGDDWGTLIHLVNEDFNYLDSPPEVADAATWLADRLDRARRRMGIWPFFAGLDPKTRQTIEDAIRQEAQELLNSAMWRRRTPGQTVIIEFARGGSVDTEPPLPNGYQNAIAMLSPTILQRCSILYVWVTPEQSRQRNRERSRPDEEGSILFHGVPERVMREEYGQDDLMWLLDQSDHPGSIEIMSQGSTYQIPTAVFDNRDDLTSFLRSEVDKWPSESVAAVRSELERALDSLR